MSLTRATISGQLVNPGLGAGAMSVAIHATSDGSRLAYAGGVIAGKYPVKILTDGTATVSLPLLPQAGVTPAGALWRLVWKLPGHDPVHWDFPLAGDTTWNALVVVADVTITAAIQAAAEAARDAAIAARDAALAAVAAVAVSTWQATTSYVAGQTVQAPDGSRIKRISMGTSRGTFDATEQASWTVVASTTGTLEQTAGTDARTLVAWKRAPRINDLVFPVVMAHRGFANVAGENTLDAYKEAVAKYGTVVNEAGDVRALSDGTLVSMHDATVDRTTNGTGNVNTFTKATWQALTVDIQTLQGGTYVGTPPPVWDDVLDQLAGKGVITPEVKDQLDSTATAMCDRMDALGVRDSAIINSFALSNLVIAAGRGYKPMLNGTTHAAMLTNLAAIITNNIWAVGLDYTQADVNAAAVAFWQGIGVRVILYTIDHQADYNIGIGTYGADGLFANEPTPYLQTNVAAYRKKTSTWHLDGRFPPGSLWPGVGPYNASTRGTLVGVKGAWRWQPLVGQNNHLTAGQVCPVPSPAGSYTVTVGSVFETIPSTTSQGPAVSICAPDDLASHVGGADTNLAYVFKIRASGGIQAWKIDAAGTATSLGTATCTAVQNLTLTAGLTQGVAVTTLSVAALTVALKVGHQFMLPNGQIATVNAAAIIGATSVTIVSLLPASNVANGSVLKPYVIFTFTVSPTTVTFQRGDETSVAAISTADTTYRGAYITLAAGAAASGVVSYHKVAVA